MAAYAAHIDNCINELRHVGRYNKDVQANIKCGMSLNFVREGV